MNKSETALDCVEVELGRPAKKSIIVLHGLGADGNDFVPFVTELQLPSSLGVRFIFPHAPLLPITINNGYVMRAWYDITSLSLTANHDAENIKKSTKFVEHIIEKENARGVSTDNIMLAGFSQGAVIALTTGIFYPKRLAGIIALSGYFPLTAELHTNAAAANQKVPIFLAHGTLDPIVPYPLGEAAQMTLSQAGYPISWHSYMMPHTVCPEEISDLSRWLKNIWPN